MFYISGYFEEHREEYYAGLAGVSRDGDWSAWCRFFLRAVQAQAEEDLAKTTAIFELHGEMRLTFVEATHSRYSIQALDWVFERPVFRGSEFTTNAGIPRATAKRLLSALQEQGMLRAISPGTGRRAAMLALPRLLNIVEGREVF
jgi:Fic family protein